MVALPREVWRTAHSFGEAWRGKKPLAKGFGEGDRFCVLDLDGWDYAIQSEPRAKPNSTQIVSKLACQSHPNMPTKCSWLAMHCIRFLGYVRSRSMEICAPLPLHACVCPCLFAGTLASCMPSCRLASLYEVKYSSNKRIQGSCYLARCVVAPQAMLTSEKFHKLHMRPACADKMKNTTHIMTLSLRLRGLVFLLPAILPAGMGISGCLGESFSGVSNCPLGKVCFSPQLC